MNKRYTVTVQVAGHDITGKTRVVDGEAEDAVTIVTDYLSPEQTAWIADNREDVDYAIREAAEAVYDSEEDAKSDRGFDLYDDESSYGGEDFGGIDDLWG